jgi:hypothetical protein
MKLPTVYHSASKNRDYVISDEEFFNQYHIASATAKVRRAVEAGDERQRPMLLALEAELKRREPQP